ncbi:hypothetical protein GCM10007968_20140 [Sporolactobacillus putidus]|uniref:Uncharacterized protein n=1 Tax=Sporolactobacillus putidus TaxID=492735 RepID=A0A917W2Z8_9BACL|nr:hypothetical protein GCM10007968_20140 [Sporolactobacillus putidus]
MYELLAEATLFEKPDNRNMTAANDKMAFFILRTSFTLAAFTLSVEYNTHVSEKFSFRYIDA